MGKPFRIDRPAPAYDEDFMAWAYDQANRLRMLRATGLDTDHLAAEIDALGRSQERELLSRCTVLLLHLLKWQHQPIRRGRSWQGTIMEQRIAIADLLQDSPSLRPDLPVKLARAYANAVKRMSASTGVAVATIPPSCPWTPAQLLDEDWLPGG